MMHQTHSPHPVRAAPSQLLMDATEMDARTHETAATLASVTALHEISATTASANHHRCRTSEARSATKTSPPSTTTASATALRTTTSPPSQQLSEYAVLMTTIGLGIDPFFGATPTSRNATVASVKAVRDAMERGVLRFPDEPNLHLHIQLGVPALEQGLEPMHVELGHLTPLLPTSIPLLPIEVVVGGLLVRDSAANAACTAVACISLRRASTRSHTTERVIVPPRGITKNPTSSSVSRGGAGHTGARLPAVRDPPVTVPTSWAQLEQQQDQSSSSEAQMARLDFVNTKPPTVVDTVHRSTSIDMLAQVSAEMHDQTSPDRELNRRQEQEVGEATGSATNAANLDPTSYNYKKLPPGVTTKKNKRLFVQHNYRDHSQDLPESPDEKLLVGPGAPHRTNNAAFPLKLHETLSLIEREGHEDVIGWMPHGRSFKIHKQREFVDLILPKYFVMTKKSSFLRQLNLYGFNRLCSATADQGSYYHEKFLRGMKFLCRRIHRQKVNGNGIRAAGNPDGEPTLSRYPVCPPEHHLTPQVVAVASSPAALVPEVTSSPKNGGHKATSSSPRPPTHAAIAVVPSMSLQPHPQLHIARQTEAAEVLVSVATQDQRGVTQPPGTVFCSTASASQPASFPLKLQRILDKMEAEGHTDVITWLPHGRAFIVYDVDRFVNELMPLYFNQTKYSSFQRQLHMYHFQRITAGRDKGAYHHASFQRGRPELCLGMTRTRVNGKGTRRPGNPEREPHFYELPPLPTIAPGTRIDIPHEVPNSRPRTHGDTDDHSHDSSEGTWHSTQNN